MSTTVSPSFSQSPLGNSSPLSTTYLRSSETRAENGFRASSAGRSFAFPRQKRSRHDVKTQRLVHASKIGWFGSRVGNSKEQISSKANLL